MDTQLDFIVKLGGSAITKKEEFECVKESELKKTAQILFQCWKEKKKFIVVHGAGSFGHHQAKQFHVKQGYSSQQEGNLSVGEIKTGFCLTRISVCKLNAMVVKALVDAGITAISQSACGVWETENDLVTDNPCKHIKSLLAAGFIPVLHGDCVLDSVKGCTILSGDTICQVLCEYFHPPRVIFASDVNGVYDKPPQNEDAILLPLILTSSAKDLEENITLTTCKHDVTGGIRLKLDSSIEIVEKGDCEVFICNANSQSFFKACIGEDLQNLIGTTIRKR